MIQMQLPQGLAGCLKRQKILFFTLKKKFIYLPQLLRTGDKKTFYHLSSKLSLAAYTTEAATSSL